MAKLVSVVLPCRNEEQTIGQCIRSIQKSFREEKIDGEIIVSDSSSDNSPRIARRLGAIVIRHNKKGYGIAVSEGIKAARGRYIIIGDADGTYDFGLIPRLLNKIEQGYDLVLGSRFRGNIRKNAMPWHHQYVGNPILSWLLNIFFRTDISDTNSGFRIIRKDTLSRLDCRTTGMEYASEMIIKAVKNSLRIAEVPVDYYPRKGHSKLNSFSDGWRHLRFMLMFSPTYLFIIPGLAFLFAGFGLLAGGFVVPDPLRVFFLSVPGSALCVLGYQIASLGLYSRIYAIHTGFEKSDRLIDFIAAKVPLERGLFIGFYILLTALASFFVFYRKGIGTNYVSAIPGIMLGLTLFIIGIQTFFSVFFISMMLVEKK